MAIDLTQAVLVPKPTKVEFDSKRLRTKPEKLRYGADADIIWASHERQLKMRALVRKLLPEVRLMKRSSVSKKRMAGASLVIALGGDNHFIFVSHALDSIPILGINSDRVRSHGGLLGIDESNVEATVAKLRAGEFSIHAWTRLECRPGGMATSEVFIGERDRLRMSRHVLRKDGDPEEEHRSSGLLVATGAGSTGWYGTYDRAFDRTLRVAKWQLTEAFPHDHKYRYGTGELEPGATLTVRSRNDRDGILAVDSEIIHPLPRGGVATIRISPQSLRVVWM
jgi:NAD kinase